MITNEEKQWARMAWAVEQWKNQPSKYFFGKREVYNFLRSYIGLDPVIGDTDLYMRHIAQGIKYKYPSCCIKNFADLAFKGIPSALYYDLIGRGHQSKSPDYIMCDKCFHDFIRTSKTAQG